MTDPRHGGPRPEAEVGLCATCVHSRTVRTARSTFWLCGRSRTDPSFPKYPRLPVLRCRGYESREGPADAGP